MDPLQTRLEALEQQMDTVNRRLRWWRGRAGGLIVLAVLTWALPSGTAQEEARTGSDPDVDQRLAALEQLLRDVSSASAAHERPELVIRRNVRIIGNLQIVNGLGQTDCGPEEEPIPDCPNGLGNLIVGYKEPRGEEFSENIRTGSHNVVVGREHNFSRFGGIVIGLRNAISGDFASVSGGQENTASGPFAAVSGGGANTASGNASSVSGGGKAKPSAPSLRSVGEVAIRPAAPVRQSVGGLTTRPAAPTPRSAVGATGRRKASSTGWPAASSKTSRDLAAVVTLRRWCGGVSRRNSPPV